MNELAVIPYVDAQHRDFVMGSFARCMLSTWPWSAIPFRVIEERFLRQLRSPHAKALMSVLAEEPDTFCAWVVTRPRDNEIVAGYTRRPLRRRWGIGSSLAIAGGINFELPVGVWFWTYACERIVRDHAGYGRLYHKVTDEEDPARRRISPPRDQPARDNGAPQRGAAGA